MKRNRIACWLWGMAALVMLLKLMALLDPVLPSWSVWCGLGMLMLGGLLAYRSRDAKTPS